MAESFAFEQKYGQNLEWVNENEARSDTQAICRRASVKALLKAHGRVTMERTAIEEMLGVGKARLFAILEQYRIYPKTFSLT